MKIVAILGSREEYLQFEVLKGLVRMGVELIPSTPLDRIAGLINNTGAGGLYLGCDVISGFQTEYTDEEIIEHSKDADYIFVFWNKFPTATSTGPGGRMHLVDMINEPDKTVVIDGSEYSYTGYGRGNIWKDSRNYHKGSGTGDAWIWHYMRDRARWYFKRETLPEDIDEHNIIPCPYPFRIEDRQEQFHNLDKEIDLLCSFGQTFTGLRSEVEASCKRLERQVSNKIAIGQFRPRIKCLETICKSKMVLDAWGGGNNTVRKSETIMNSTAFIGQKWEIVVPNDFIDGETIINWENINEFEEKVDYYFKNLDKLIEIGKNGYEHVLKYHTTEQTMKYIFNMIS